MKLVLFFLVHFAFSKSENTGPCKWMQGVNSTYLERLKPLVGNSYKFWDAEKKYEYTINICGGTDRNAVVQTSNGGKVAHKIGDMNDGDLTAGSDWLLLFFFNGEPYDTHCHNQNRSAMIMLNCDPWAGKGYGVALRENTDDTLRQCYYLFEINTALVCPKHGLSAGSIFVIIFFVVVGVYLLVGFFYQRLVNRASGWEQLPNYDFWVKFGALQADGCDFLCRCGGKQESREYRNIDEALAGESQSVPRNEQSDDHLLNM